MNPADDYMNLCVQFGLCSKHARDVWRCQNSLAVKEMDSHRRFMLDQQRREAMAAEIGCLSILKDLINRRMKFVDQRYEEAKAATGSPPAAAPGE